MKLKSFLNKYDTVIFDMDGVITSEENYWTSAALTVAEYMSIRAGADVDTEMYMRRAGKIRETVFCGDKLIGLLKAKGVNSNWDLGYVTVLCAQIAGGEGDSVFTAALKYAKTLPDNIIDAYDALAERCAAVTGESAEDLRRNGKIWREMHGLFQEWFLGDILNGKPSKNGFKSGLIEREEPIIPKGSLLEILRLLSSDKRVCTGTGRPGIEMQRPLSDWGALRYFSPDGLCCYDHVEAAENALGNNALTKPHPYMFLKALYGTDYDDKKIVEELYDKDKIKRALIVGDAGADILAARAMGADFCAVLTGINGEKSRGYFEGMKAEYILNSIADFIEEE